VTREISGTTIIPAPRSAAPPSSPPLDRHVPRTTGIIVIFRLLHAEPESV